MCELVEHEIHAIIRLGGAFAHRVPGENESAEVMAGVPKAMFAAFLPDAAAYVPLFVGNVARWIDEDRNQLRVVVGLAMQEQQARLSGDGDANLVGEHQPTAALEMLLGEKYLGVTEQLRLIFRGETVEDGQIALEYFAPRFGRGSAPQVGAAAGFEQVENHL